MSEFSKLNGYDIKDKKAIRTYNNVSLMKSDTTIKEGQTIKTLGYYSIGDGGLGEYIIVNDNTLVADDGSIHDLENGLKAKLISNNFITPKLFGAYGDGIHDDITALNNCRNYCINNNLIMRANSNDIFGVSEYFDILTGCSYDFENATIKALNNMNYLVRQHKVLDTANIPVYSEFTKNIIIDCDNKANYGFYQDILGWSILTENIRVISPKQIGIYIKAGQIRLHNAKVEQENNIDSIGLQVDSTDSEYYNIVTRDCSTGIKVTGSSNGFYECHPVMFKTSLLTNSIGIDVSGWNVFIHPICDTFKYAFYIRHYGGCVINGGQVVTNTTYYNSDTMSDTPYFLYFAHSTGATARMEVSGCTLDNSAIIGTDYEYITNVDTWESGNFILNNPSIAWNNNLRGLPKELSQINSVTSLSDYLNSDFTAGNIQATINGNIVEYRITNLTLPAINQTVSRVFASSLPIKFVPQYNKLINCVTDNGISVVITAVNNGGLSITALGGNITAGDKISFTHMFMK